MGGRVCLLYSTLYWTLIHLTLSGVFFARPFYWSFLHLTLSGVFFARGVASQVKSYYY